MKNKILKSAVLFIAMITLHAVGNAQTNKATSLQQAKKDITRINSIYFDLYAKNDGSILKLYTRDACLMPPNAAAICGREALAKDFTDTYAAGNVSGGKFVTTAVYGDGSGYITEEGSFNIFGKNGETIDDGKYLKLWKKTKEGWQIFRDSFNSNRKQQ